MLKLQRAKGDGPVWIQGPVKAVYPENDHVVIVTDSESFLVIGDAADIAARIEADIVAMAVKVGQATGKAARAELEAA